MRAIVLTSVGCLALATTGPVAATAATPTSTQHATARVSAASSVVTSTGFRGQRTNTLLNANWAGYAQTGSTHQASARFSVPRTAGSPGGFSSTWVGIDGYHNAYLAQVGIGTDVVGGRAYHYAWWEVITPSAAMPEQRFGIPVRAGDVVDVRVTVSRGRAVMSIANVTRKRSAWHSYRYAGPCRSAEWVQEDVNVNGRISPSPNFRRVSFSRVVRNGVNAHLSSSQALDIVDRHGTRETRTSAPTKSRNAFTVTWLHAGTWTTPR